MIILGLTGSIGMGKSTAAAMLARMGLPVHDADAAVHRLMAPGGAAVDAVAERFPSALVDGVIDRGNLGAEVFGDRAALADLEAILHPLVRRAEERFIRIARGQRRRAVVLDVPLLFESGREGRCDRIILVTAPKAVQTRRVMARPGMTEARLEAIRAKQMNEREKRRRADFIVWTSLGRADTWRRLTRIVSSVTNGL
ncbi:MAG: dephospho-CoA kinase [Rhodospirillales bacterium]